MNVVFCFFQNESVNFVPLGTIPFGTIPFGTKNKTHERLSFYLWHNGECAFVYQQGSGDGKTSEQSVKRDQHDAYFSEKMGEIFFSGKSDS